MTLTRRGLFALTASAAAARKLPAVVAPPVDALAPFKALVSNEIPRLAWVTVGEGGDCRTLCEARRRVQDGGVIYLMPGHHEVHG